MANYSKGKIAIPNVTGNVVINIAAVPSAPMYTNLADPTSADWLVNTRLSTFSTSAETGTDTTNYIPCSYGDTIRVRNLGVGEANRRLGFYDTDKVRSSADVGYLQHLIANGGGTYDAETDTYTFTAGEYWNLYTSEISHFTNIGYIRMCGKYKTGKTSSDVIITVNEEIK